MLAYTFCIALGFIALGRLQLALFEGLASRDLFERSGLIDSAPDAALLRLAEQVAADSRVAAQRLPSGHRVAAFHIGYDLSVVGNP